MTLLSVPFQQCEFAWLHCFKKPL